MRPGSWLVAVITAHARSHMCSALHQTPFSYFTFETTERQEVITWPQLSVLRASGWIKGSVSVHWLPLSCTSGYLNSSSPVARHSSHRYRRKKLVGPTFLQLTDITVDSPDLCMKTWPLLQLFNPLQAFKTLLLHKQRVFWGNVLHTEALLCFPGHNLFHYITRQPQRRAGRQQSCQSH